MSRTGSSKGKARIDDPALLPWPETGAGGTGFEEALHEDALVPVDFVPSAGKGTGLAESLAAAHAGAPAGLAAPDVDADPIITAATTRPAAGRAAQTAAVILSLALHASATYFFLEPPETVQIAGGQPASVVMLGSDAFENTALAGETADEPLAPEPTPAETVEPVEPAEEMAEPVEPVENAARPSPDVAEPVEPDAPAEPLETPTVEAELPDAVTPNGVVVAEPTAPEEARPVEPEETVSEPPTAAPVEPEIAAEQPVETAEAIEPLPDPIENAPVPTPRPEYTPPPPPPPRQQTAERPEPRQPAAGSQGNAQANQQRGSAEGQATQGASQEGAREAARANAAGNAAVSNYPGQVVTRLRRALRYPSEARRDRLTGEVHVSFTVTASGGVGGVSVVRSSGYPVLDQAAVATVQRAAPFPAIPDAAGRSSWPFTVPLAFTR